MYFFAEVFDALSSLSTKLPSAPVGAYFIVVLIALILTGVVVGFCYLGNSAGKMKRSVKKALAYLKSKTEINDDNVGDFTYTCFGNSSPRALREAWVKYLGVRFGYPSDIVSEKDVFDREVKKNTLVYASVFIGVALILVAFFAFWSISLEDRTVGGVIVFTGLLVSGIIYLVLVGLSKKQYASTRELFYELQDELDAKVDLQVEKDFSTDASPLYDMTAMIDDIIARNTAKVVDIPTEEPATETETVEEQIAEGAAEEEPNVLTKAEENTQAQNVDEQAQDTTPEQNVVISQTDDVSLQADNADDVTDAEIPAVIAKDEANEEPREEAVDFDKANSDEEENAPAEAKSYINKESVVDSDSEWEPVIQENDEATKVPNAEVPAENVAVDEAPSVSETEETPKIENTSEEETGISYAQAGEDMANDASFRLLENEEDGNNVTDEANINRATLIRNPQSENIMNEEGVDDWLAGQNEFGMAPSVEPFEEVNIEDEEVMFGKKKKEKEAAAAAAAVVVPQKSAKAYADADIFVESEIIADETPAPTPAAAPAPAPAPVKEPEPTFEPVESAPVEHPEFKPTIIPAAPVAPMEPEIIEEVEDLDEGDEDIKAPRLSKLPHLVDYVLSMNVSRATKIKVAMLMLQAYKVFKDSPENKVICVQCLGKIITALKA